MPGSAAVPAFVSGRILRSRYAILATMSLASGIVAGGRGDWDVFAEVGRRMLGTDGLHVFARALDTQSGPLALLTVRLFAVTPRNGFVLCTIACAALGLFAIRQAELAALESSGAAETTDWDAMQHVRERIQVTTLLGGVVLVFGWAKLGGYGHLDDAFVLAAAVASTRLVRRDAHIAAAVLVGAALAVKPWAVLFVPLLVVHDTQGARSRLHEVWLTWRPAVLAGLIGAALWAPFIVAEPDTLQSIRPTVRVAGDSVLALFGIDTESLPNWMRVVQLVAAIAVGLVAMYLRRTAGLVAAVVGARIMTDPATWSYYTPGLVVGALVWDLCAQRRMIPVATIVASLLLAPSWLVADDDVRAVLRLIAGIAAVAVVLAVSERAPSANPSCPSSDPSAVD